MLGPRSLRWLKALHEALVAVLVGSLAGILLLLWRVPADNAEQAALDAAAYLLFDTLVTWAFVAVLLSGLVFSTASRWGFARHRWIAAKWAGFGTLFAIAWFGLGPALGGVAGLSAVGLPATSAGETYAGFARAATLATLAMLAVALVLIPLSTHKPWGLWRRAPAVPRWLVLAAVGAGLTAGGALWTATALQLRAYRQLAVADSHLSGLPDGTYAGAAEFAGFTYRVAVTLHDGRILDVRVLANRDSPFARLAEGVHVRMLREQNANVQAITGATTTSKALMKAVEDALSRPPAAPSR